MTPFPLDSKTFQDVITSFGQYDFKPGGLCVYDRGITSGRNLLDVKALRWDTLCGVAFNPKVEKLWRDILAGGNLEQYDNHVRLKYRLGKIGISAEDALCELATMDKVYLRDTKHVFKLSRVVTLIKKRVTICTGRGFHGLLHNH